MRQHTILSRAPLNWRKQKTRKDNKLATDIKWGNLQALGIEVTAKFYEHDP